MKQRLITSSLIFFLTLTWSFAQLPLKKANNGFDTNNNTEQNGEYRDGAGRRTTWGRDTTSTDKEEKTIPIGQFQWRIEPRLGTIIDAENNDTVVHNFQSFNNTEGYTGQYNFLGNAGSPRLNRIFLKREVSDDFLFLQPFSFFRTALQDFRFTNTLSPITNLAYHKCGSKENGEDRIRANFATNINKISGIGFKIDYLYGRGYYNNQANSMFGSTFYGYYRGDRYNAHAYININHMKMGENGGIEDDRYIEDPQSFPQKYSSKDIPVLLNQTWNRNHEQNFYLTHKYNLGFYKDIIVPDSLKPTPPSAGELLSDLPDSLQQVLRTDSVARKLAVDSLLLVWKNNQITPQEFVPVTSLIHTMDVKRLVHGYLSHNTPNDYYTNHYFGEWNAVKDETRGLSVRNTFGIALREGFNKWAQMGIALFGTHNLRTYNLPSDMERKIGYTENDISVGGEISRTQGKFIHYNANGELWLLGPKSGDFSVDALADMEFPITRKDSMIVELHGFVKHQKPDFYFRHYHSQSTWWDNENLSREIRSRVEGTLRLKKFGTRLNVGFENIKDYTYFAMQNTLKADAETGSLRPGDYTHAVNVKQSGKNIQVFSATLSQDLKFGPVHWDNEVSYQKSSQEDILPLPDVSLYTNLYFLFRIARVLRVQLGGDMRYFTSYYAPDYAPSIGQFAIQDTSNPRVKIGNYPIVNAYINMHLKHCRIYLSMNHVNAGSGHSFMAPHYAINPRTFHFGVSWNFFN